MNPIEGAKVRVYFHGTYEENCTDSSGYYHVTNIPICRCLKNATASKDGYTTEWVLLTIWENTTYDFVLTPLGNTLYVGGSGPGNYTRIQDAINNTSNGDTVFVYDESSPYFENLIVNKSINLIGENRDTTVIDGDGEKNIVTITAENVLISGFSIQTGEDITYRYGISICSNLTTISGNILINNYFGIHIYEYTDSKIIGNNFINNVVGLYLKSRGNIVKNNYFFNDGISISTSGNIIENNTVNFKPLIYLEGMENKIIDYDTGQIILFNCNNITIKNQTIKKTLAGIKLYQCDNCVIEKNLISESKVGIILSYCNHNNVSFNHVYKNQNLGIALHNSDYNRLQNNICEEQISGEYSYHGLHAHGAHNNTIIKNVFIENGVGVCFTHSNDNNFSCNVVDSNYYIGFHVEFNSENNLISNNRISKNYRGLYLDEVSYDKIKNNNFIDNDDDLVLNIYQYYKFSLRRFPYIDGNFWGRARVFPMIILGEFTFVFSDVPWGGYHRFHLPFVDWHPAQEPYDIHNDGDFSNLLYTLAEKVT
jgi:parallel beta-helix repeat protein